MPPPAIEVRRISKHFPGVLALDDVSLSIQPREVHALVGQNGAGKSTLIKILAGTFPPDAGELRVQDEVVQFSSPREAIKRGIVTISQEMSLIPTLTAAENIFVGQLPVRTGRRVDWAAARLAAGRLLEELGFHIDPLVEVSQLSIAQQQGVEIARALSRQADIVIMDEPTSALAAQEVERLLKTIDRLRERGATVIYVSHRLDEVFRISDRLSVFREGQHVTTVDSGATNQDEVVRLMVGRGLAVPKPRKRAVDYAASPILEVQSLTRAGVFEDISFKLYPGEILGLSGLVGSGRTEIVRAIFGADPIDSGRVLVNGHPVKRPRPDRMIANSVALAPEDRKRDGLILQMAVNDNLSLATLAQRAGYHLRRFFTERARARDRIRSLSIRTPGLSTPVVNLSGGNQQKVVIGKWLDIAPRVLLVDEPTRGIDIAAKADIFQIMKDLADQGMAIIMISSEQVEILHVTDRILVLHQGRIAVELAATTATEAMLTQAAFGRLSTPSLAVAG